MRSHSGCQKGNLRLIPTTLAAMNEGNCHIQQSLQNFFSLCGADSAGLDVESDFLKVE